MKVITWKRNWTIKPVINAKQTHLKMCLSRCVAGDSWARLWFHRGALELCAGRCGQNVTGSKQNCACGFLVHPTKAGLCYKGHEPNAGWIRGMYSLPRRALTTNMQICKCTPCSHTLQMDSWFVDSDSDQISRSVVSDSLRPHESQHARPPCPSPTPGVHWDSRPSSQWCHPAISSSGVPFSSCPRSLPASESFPITVAKSICVLCSWYCPEKGMI